jgi:hypothetical protein
MACPQLWQGMSCDRWCVVVWTLSHMAFPSSPQRVPDVPVLTLSGLYLWIV